MPERFDMIATQRLPMAAVGEKFRATHTEAKALFAIGKATYLTRDMEAGEVRPQPQESEVNATPAAIEMAAKLQIDLATLRGTGKNGRILATDVEAAAGK